MILPRDAVVVICAHDPCLPGFLASRVYGYPERRLTLIGVTGSTGKTSVALMSASLLCATGRRAAALVTDGVWDRGVLSRAEARVPDAVALRRVLAKMCHDGVEYAVLKLSAYQLAHGVADGLDFAVVLLTDLEARHIGKGEFSDFAAYRAAKERLTVARAAVAILPVGVALPTSGRVLRVGACGDVFAKDALPAFGGDGVPGTQFSFCVEGNEHPTFVPIPAPFAVQNAIFSICIARSVGVAQDEIDACLPCVVARGRLECVFSDGARHVYIDSAYEPRDVARTLDALAPFATARLSVVVGAVGGRALGRRAALGDVLVRHADFAYLTADDPDAEDPVLICEEIRAAMGKEDKCCIIADRAEAIERAVRDLRAGDVLLVTGKGNDETQLVMGERRPFCERNILRSVLEKIDIR